MPQTPITSTEPTARLAGACVDRRGRRCLFGAIGIVTLLAVSVAIGEWNSLAAGLLLYLAGFAAVLRLMLTDVDTS